jgi:hypothetical protein
MACWPRPTDPTPKRACSSATAQSPRRHPLRPRLAAPRRARPLCPLRAARAGRRPDPRRNEGFAQRRLQPHRRAHRARAHARASPGATPEAAPHRGRAVVVRRDRGNHERGTRLRDAPPGLRSQGLRAPAVLRRLSTLHPRAARTAHRARAGGVRRRRPCAPRHAQGLAARRARDVELNTSLPGAHVEFRDGDLAHPDRARRVVALAWRLRRLLRPRPSRSSRPLRPRAHLARPSCARRPKSGATSGSELRPHRVAWLLHHLLPRRAVGR